MSFHGNRRHCLGSQNFATRLEVDQAKVSIIETVFPPTTIKGIRNFLGHAGFYIRFIERLLKNIKATMQIT